MGIDWEKSIIKYEIIYAVTCDFASWIVIDGVRGEVSWGELSFVGAAPPTTSMYR